MAIKDAPVVNMLQFDEKEAYNHDRPISSLIRTQLLHLHTAEYMKVPAVERTNININDLHTERQASEYIAKVTALLHKHAQATSPGSFRVAGPRTIKRTGASRSQAAHKVKKTKAATKKRASRK